MRSLRYLDLVDRLRRAVFGVGPVATIKAALWGLLRLDAQTRRRRAGEQTSDLSAPRSPFDIQYGVDTDGFLGWRDLRSGHQHDAFISGYFGTTPSIGRRLLATIDHPEDYTFIDFGCGKGRALILASERPFKRILGVEIAAPLVDAARRNACVVAERFPERTGIEIVHADATSLDWPTGSLALFFYQPFERPVMRVLLASLAQTLAKSPRPAILIYLHPPLRPIIDREPYLHRRTEGTVSPAFEEVPWTYGGRGAADSFAIWSTRSPNPNLLPFNETIR